MLGIGMAVLTLDLVLLDLVLLFLGMGKLPDMVVLDTVVLVWLIVLLGMYHACECGA